MATFDGPAREQSVGIVTGATLVAAVGFLDDRGWLHHQIKLFVGMPIAACILLATGIHAQAFEFIVPGLVPRGSVTSRSNASWATVSRRWVRPGWPDVKVRSPGRTSRVA